MKGIFLTEEGKQEIEAKIAKLKSYLDKIDLINNPTSYDRTTTKLAIYKEILSSATVLPVRQTWEDTEISNDILPISDLADYYPNGVIIKS